MNRLIPGLLTLVVAAFALAALLTGDAIWAVPVLILLGIVGLMFVGQVVLKQRLERADGGPALPAAHVETEDDTALGDTAQAHDEITPHDLPKDHRGRAAAEREADHSDEALVRGNVE